MGEDKHHDFENMDWQAFWEESYKESRTPWLDPDEWLVAACEGEPGGQALDLGAGEGGNSLWLAEQGWQVTAVDFAPTGLATLRAEAEARGLQLRYVEGDVRDYAGGPFDLVLLAFMHLEKEDRRRMLKNAARLVAPGGSLLYLGLTNLGYQAPPGLDHIFVPPDEVTPFLEGLDIERAEVNRRKIPYPTEDPDGQCDGVLVRARRPHSSR